TPGSDSARSSASVIAVPQAADQALRRSGRFSRTQHTPSLTSLLISLTSAPRFRCSGPVSGELGYSPTRHSRGLSWGFGWSCGGSFRGGGGGGVVQELVDELVAA